MKQLRHLSPRVAAVLTFLVCLLAPRVSAAGPGEGFEQTVKPFLAQHCAVCHNEQTKTAGVALDGFADEAAALAHPYLWEDVKNMVIRGTMPPKGMPRPEREQVDAVVRWIDEQLEKAAANATIDPGRVTARRLNRTEYNNTVRDLLGVDFRPADDFPVDDSGYGFDNIGDVLTLSPVLMEKYLAAAGKIARSTIVTERKIPEPTVERYQQTRSETGRREEQAIGEVVPFDSTGRLEIVHDFPAPGDYRIRVSGGDRRPFRDVGGMQLQPPPVYLGLFLDGDLADVMAISRGEEDHPLERIDSLFRIPAGKHRLTAEFFDSEAGLFDPNEDFERRLLWADYIEIQGPYNAGLPPLPESHKQLAECSPKEPAAQDACAERILSKLARRAYRRPVTPAEVESLVRFVRMAREQGGSFEEGLQVALQAMLVSPHFLFRIERDYAPADGDDVRQVNGFELASRLSYFMWSSMPDDELLKAAGRGALEDREGLLAQVRRMLADPKSDALVENFAGQWLQLRNLERVNPDPDLFPEFDDELRAAMERETELFFQAMLQEDRNILEFLDARFTFLNERLAEHYGIRGVKGREFRRVDVDGAERGGLLGQGSVLTVSSYPTRTSPVLRGLWVLENILDSPPPPPPPNVPELDEAEIGKNASLREQLEKHRADPSCAVCHDRIDPLGFGLENYNPVGAWREKTGAFPVDSSGELPGGLRFESPAELKKILRENNGDQFARCLIEKLLTYALGRGLERFDTPAVNEIQREVADNGYRFSSVIAAIVQSVPFQMRRQEGAETDD